MNTLENNEMFDLGSAPVSEDFDPFAYEEEPDGSDGKTDMQQMQKEEPVQKHDPVTGHTEMKNTTEKETKGTKTAESEQGYEGKPPVFAYAGALENISDVSMTFEELRIEKSGDFPELEDGKRVSWTVEYGKVTKAVSDPKGTSIGTAQWKSLCRQLPPLP